MPKTKHSCPNCGADVVAARWNAGYEYCKASQCFEALGRRKDVPLYDKPPAPGEIDLDPSELDEVAGLTEAD